MLTVEVINADTRDFVGKVFDVDFLKSNILINSLGLFEEIGTALLNGLLLRGMVNNIISDFLGFSVKRHNRLFKNILILFNFCLL